MKMQLTKRRKAFATHTSKKGFVFRINKPSKLNKQISNSIETNKLLQQTSTKKILMEDKYQKYSSLLGKNKVKPQ
jgi:hypothetical protein